MKIEQKIKTSGEIEFMLLNSVIIYEKCYPSLNCRDGKEY